MSSQMIDRREAIGRVGALLGGIALVGGGALLTACAKEGGSARADATEGVGEFTAADVAFLDEIADTMLPETTTPGAKAAKVGAFMALMVTDTYDTPDQQRFRDGMRTIDQESRAAAGAGFVQATPPQRLALLERLDREQQAHTDTPAHYFRMMKELALLGYFTSEIGCTEAQRYVESPGRFDPCVPYTRGEPSWAEHA